MPTWKLSLLWSDVMIWFLVVCVLMFVLWTLRDEHRRRPWRKVFFKPIPLAACLVFTFFLVIGLLDSVHIKIATSQSSAHEQLSVLDLVLTPMRDHVETTYSKPFGIHSFVKEFVMLPNGSMVRDYPRLEYGGAHLHDPKLLGTDLIRRFVLGSVIAIIIGFFVTCILVAYGSFQTNEPIKKFAYQLIKGQREFPWRTLIGTGWILLWLVVLVAHFYNAYHILGTSKIGEDVLFQTIKSIRTGLVIGTVTTLFMLPLAVGLGLVAGYYRGWVDDIIQYLYTTLSSIPGVLLIAASVLTLQVMMNKHESSFDTLLQRSDARLLALCFILGVTSWTGLCRLLRAEVLKLREIEFVQAARALGVKHSRILFSHMMPNVFHIILITVVLDFSGLVLAEAVLSYVGVGVDPSSYSWGTMINSARLELARMPIVWWSLTAAFSFMVILVLSANIFADAVRDAFDPRV